MRNKLKHLLTQEDIDALPKQIDDYNAKVKLYNSLVTKQKNMGRPGSRSATLAKLRSGYDRAGAERRLSRKLDKVFGDVCIQYNNLENIKTQLENSHHVSSVKHPKRFAERLNRLIKRDHNICK